MPILLMGAGMVVIVTIIVVLLRMRKNATTSEEELEHTAYDSKSVRGSKSKKQPADKVPAEASRTSSPLSGAKSSSFAPPTLQEPIEESPGIDRESFTKFARKHILVVEDNKINQKLLLTLLNASKIDLVTAEDGIEALERLRAPGAHFDLVLMDVNMPRMDGLETTREIRKDPHLKHLPVIALTASTTSEEVEVILESGMNAYLEKPVVLGKLYRSFELFMEGPSKDR